ncbi:RNA polymerase sigma-70 factor [Polaribacter batillariae]|uniref:RNA polymerase sigma-70 factor n=1 Tax=Polaribacter batillariae TaxID=2808900 RepID=A0ABX7SQR5_9FLAO|nr:RNA polymerase sigma-70 factor [Polaribacter batillariae]QTD36579.1 RNA polymerase sigma-70 factor [Polaribacter batillariae]
MMLKSLTDNELVNEITFGNTNAFKILHDKYAHSMFLYAYNVIKDKQICEDIVQNIFIDLWSKRKEIKITSVKSFLFRAVKYQIFNYFRDQKFNKEDVTRLNLIDISIDALKKMEYSELEIAVKNSVSKLPKRCKEIFELSRFENKSNKEIAEILNISIQGVKNQISKGLKHVKQDLKKQGHQIYFICSSHHLNYIL